MVSRLRDGLHSHDLCWRCKLTIQSPLVVNELTTIQVIAMYVNATTSTSGSATIENLTTGKVVTKSLTSTSALGGENAEWIVEDFEEGNSLVAFANFGNVTFTNCVASTSASSEGVRSATVMDIENSSDQVLTDTTLISDSSFKVSYTSSSTSASTSSVTSGTAGSGNGGKGGGKGGGHNGGAGKADAAGGFGFFRRWMMLSEK
jgi:Peptidase A4 family